MTLVCTGVAGMCEGRSSDVFTGIVGVFFGGCEWVRGELETAYMRQQHKLSLATIDKG